MQRNEFALTPVPPFRLDLTVWALRRRVHNQVDRWDGDTYRRTVNMARGEAVDIAVAQVDSPATPRLKVVIMGAQVNAEIKREIGATIDRLLGISVNLQSFYTLARRDKRLWPLVETFRGLKPPRFPTLFEALVNGIACQQLSLDVGITLLNRLSERFGAHTVVASAFPRPEDLAGQDSDSLRRLGFSTQKARALLELSNSICERDIELKGLSELDDDAAVQRLIALRGVGRWTAEYLLLRGLGRLEIFPGDDVGGRKRLSRWLKRSEPLDYAGVGRAVHRWQPYAGMIYFHLLLNSLAESGILQENSWTHPMKSRRTPRMSDLRAGSEPGK